MDEKFIRKKIIFPFCLFEFTSHAGPSNQEIRIQRMSFYVTFCITDIEFFGGRKYVENENADKN